MDGIEYASKDEVGQLPDLNLTLSSIDYDAPIQARPDNSQVTHAHGNEVPCSCSSHMTDSVTQDDETCEACHLERSRLKDARQTEDAAAVLADLGSLASTSKPRQDTVGLTGYEAIDSKTAVDFLCEKRKPLRRSDMEQSWPSIIAPSTVPSQQAAFPTCDPQSWMETLQWLGLPNPISGSAPPSASERCVDSAHQPELFDTCPPTTQSFDGCSGAPHTGSSCDADNVFYDFLASSSDNFPSTQACNTYPNSLPECQLSHLRYDAHSTPSPMEHLIRSAFQVPRAKDPLGPSTIHSGAIGALENMYGHGRIMQAWEGMIPDSAEAVPVARRSKIRGMKRPLSFEGVGKRRPFTLTADTIQCQHHMSNGDGESNGQMAMTYEPQTPGDRPESRGRIPSPVTTLESGGALPIDLDQELKRLRLQMLPVSRPKFSSPLDVEDEGGAEIWAGEDGEIMDRPHLGEVGIVDVASNESEGDSYPSKGAGEGARELQVQLDVVKTHYQNELLRLTEQEELTCQKVIQAASEPPPLPSRMPWAVAPSLSPEELGQRLAAVRGLFQTSHRRILDVFRRDCTAVIAGSSGGHGSKLNNRRFNLPKHAVQAMRSWLFNNFLVPYPGEKDKRALSYKTGLTPSQVNNWFINARVRLWRPLLEELCREQRQEDQAFRHLKHRAFVLGPEGHGSVV